MGLPRRLTAHDGARPGNRTTMGTEEHTMRAEEGDKLIEDLAKDAAKGEEGLEGVVVEDKSGPAHTKPAHRTE